MTTVDTYFGTAQAIIQHYEATIEVYQIMALATTKGCCLKQNQQVML